MVGKKDLVGRWWNGRYGRIARRDIWLYTDDDRWLVEAREGDSDSPVQTWPFACEPDARALVTKLIETSGGAPQWRDLTGLYRRGDGRPTVNDDCDG